MRETRLPLTRGAQHPQGSLYDLERPRTLNPYSYAGGNPTTWTDPDGLSPAYIYGLERQNASLQGQVEFLSAVAVWQAAHIRNLEASLAYVKRVAKWQAGRIRQLENQVEFLEGVARWQSAVINNQRQTIWNQAVQINQLNATINTLQHTIHQLTRPRPSGGHAGTGRAGHGPKGYGPKNHPTKGIQGGACSQPGIHCTTSAPACPSWDDPFCLAEPICWLHDQIGSDCSTPTSEDIGEALYHAGGAFVVGCVSRIYTGPGCVATGGLAGFGAFMLTLHAQNRK